MTGTKIPVRVNLGDEIAAALRAPLRSPIKRATVRYEEDDGMIDIGGLFLLFKGDKGNNLEGSFLIRTGTGTFLNFVKKREMNSQTLLDVPKIE